jgi:MFS family permease
MNKPKLWTKDFLAISVVNLFTALNFYLLMVIISVFAKDTFQSSPSMAGLAASIFVIGGIATRLSLGRYIERIGRKRILLIGLIATVVVTGLYFLATSYAVLLVIRFLHGAAFGIVTSAAGAIAGGIVPRERMGEGMAYFISLSATLATAVGPFLGIYISQYGSYTTMFLVCLIFSILSLAFSAVLRVPEVKLTREQIKETGSFKLGSFLEKNALPISAVGILVYLGYSGVLSFFSTYTKEINLSDVSRYFFVVYSIAILVSRPFVGLLFDRKGANWVMYPAILLFVAGMAILSQAGNGYTLLLSGVLIGFGLGTIQSSCQAISIALTPVHRIGLATSTFLMFIDIAVGIGPVLLGAFVPVIGYRGMYEVATGLVLLSMLGYYILHGRKAGKNKLASHSRPPESRKSH